MRAMTAPGSSVLERGTDKIFAKKLSRAVFFTCKSHRFLFIAFMQVGACNSGSAARFALHPAMPLIYGQTLQLLAKFAYFCGVGSHTTMGMGQDEQEADDRWQQVASAANRAWGMVEQAEWQGSSINLSGESIEQTTDWALCRLNFSYWFIV